MYTGTHSLQVPFKEVKIYFHSYHLTNQLLYSSRLGMQFPVLCYDFYVT